MKRFKGTSPFTKMSRINSIKYLIKNNVYGNEWQGAGMFEIIIELMDYKGKIDEYYLKGLLKKAEDN